MKSLSEEMQEELEPIFEDEYSSLCPSRKGDLAEYYAVTWLWDEGYEVFKNCGCSGDIDLIGMKNNETILIDVKTSGTTTKAGRTQEQKERKIVILAFDPKLRTLRWMQHQKEKSYE
jgi:Holliday junction resolvase-like predicted endonuclease